MFIEHGCWNLILLAVGTKWKSPPPPLLCAAFSLKEDQWGIFF